MCEECGRRRCVAACPGFLGQSADMGRIVGTCSVCKAILYSRDLYFRVGGALRCESCADKKLTENIKRVLF